MKKKFIIILFASLLILVYVFFFFIKNTNLSNRGRSIVDEIDSVMHNSSFSSFKGAVLIEHKDKIVYHESFGENIKRNTAFWIGSLAKPFTAILIMKLVEDGQIELNDPISKYLIDVPIRMKEITIYHLLTHTSGLPDNYVLDGISDLSVAKRTLFNSNLEVTVGERNYTALGYNMLVMIIEKVSGKLFEQFVRETILEKADMQQTGFWGFEDEINVRLAAIPSFNRDEIPFTIFENGKSVENYGYKGGTGIFITTADIHKFASALLQNKFLSKKNTDELFKPHFLIRSDEKADVYQGFDWAVEYRNDVLHEIRKSGAEDWLSHNSMLRFYPNEYKIIVLSNSGVYDHPGKLQNTEWSTVVSIALKKIITD